MIRKLILKKIKEYQQIIIFGHVRPDGDCYGSQFGLKDIIKQSFPNKNVYVTGDTSNYVSFLGEMDKIDELDLKDSLAICLDTANHERISSKRYLEAKEIIKIDHHEDVDQYGNINFVDTSFSSCAQMIGSFLLKFPKLKISKQGAEALYVGIVTDTSRFKYQSTNKDTFLLAAHLLEKKVDIASIDEKLSIETIEALKLKAHMLNSIQVTSEGFVYFVVTKKVIEEFKVSEEDASSMIGLIGNIKGYPIWALFLESKDEVRIRLRSRGPRIDLLANEFNGGGHKMASGAKIKNFDEMPKFIDKVNQLLSKNQGDL